MSNRVVSSAYRAIIDDVMKSVQPDFEDQGIEKEYLEELQRLWEHKIIHSQVAEFDGAPPLPPRQSRAERKELEAQAKATQEDEIAPESSSTAEAGEKRKRSDSPTGAPSGKARAPDPQSDEIGSDLDDSEDDEEGDAPGAEGADGDQDMILCLYDKVARVRNKWKCVFKDGIASVDGRDYLFAKASAELEW